MDKLALECSSGLKTRWEEGVTKPASVHWSLLLYNEGAQQQCRLTSCPSPEDTTSVWIRKVK